ncbi:MAG: class I SAM-dependent methyltransferase [Gloeomargarita sp. SKYBB_i_bin120]|nr:class I SAM-dependent methyltransferase [Gloeomargarita sp. SKYB120]MDW8177148.1 class I SAM-dependent methyltransferase [Gloeomargarita sp. SKYBB_i_bin120]
MTAPVLTPDQRRKLDERDDALFYQMPRLVTHVDDGFIQQLTQLYRERLTPGGCILDLMSSWVSHLPPEMDFAEVVGHGMNAEELARNPRLTRYFVQNLNRDLRLPLADHSFDAVLNAVSVQYLQYPEAIFAEIHRVLKPGGIAIVSFSNRMFYQKAIQAWRDATDEMRIELVKRYFQAVPGFGEIEVIARRPVSVNLALAWLGLGAGDPFYAVLARKVG